MRIFPTLPKFKYEWASLNWEPVAGSGERITAFIVVRNVKNIEQVQIFSCFSPQQMQCLFGENSSRILELLEFVKSLLLPMTSQPKLANLNIGLSGFFLGSQGYVFADTIYQATQTSVRESSLFGNAVLAKFSETIVHTETPVLINEPPTHVTSVFLQNVIKEVIIKNPNLKSYFSVRRQFAESARPTTIDFLGKRLIANLQRLKPGRTLNQDVKLGKQRLWDLSTSRHWFEEKKKTLPDESDRDFELITLTQNYDDNKYTKNDLREAKYALSALEIAAKYHQLKIYQVNTETIAAERILTMEN